jgi:DNA-binding CsgD family transcriptional regulator
MLNHRRRGRPPHDDVLTPAEWKVTHAVQHGMTNRGIAQRSGISRDGVKFHIANVLAKLGLANRKALRHWLRAPKGSALEQRETTMVASAELGPRSGSQCARIPKGGCLPSWRRRSVQYDGRARPAGNRFRHPDRSGLRGVLPAQASLGAEPCGRWSRTV